MYVCSRYRAVDTCKPAYEPSRSPRCYATAPFRNTVDDPIAVARVLLNAYARGHPGVHRVRRPWPDPCLDHGQTSTPEPKNVSPGWRPGQFLPRPPRHTRVQTATTPRASPSTSRNKFHLNIPVLQGLRGYTLDI